MSDSQNTQAGLLREFLGIQEGILQLEWAVSTTDELDFMLKNILILLFILP